MPRYQPNHQNGNREQDWARELFDVGLALPPRDPPKANAAHSTGGTSKANTAHSTGGTSKASRQDFTDVRDRLIQQTSNFVNAINKLRVIDPKRRQPQDVLEDQDKNRDKHRCQTKVLLLGDGQQVWAILSSSHGVSIGRSSKNDIVLDKTHKTVSKFHARIQWCPGVNQSAGFFELLDESATGSSVNDMYLSNSSAKLKKGDLIFLGGKESGKKLDVIGVFEEKTASKIEGQSNLEKNTMRDHSYTTEFSTKANQNVVHKDQRDTSSWIWFKESDGYRGQSESILSSLSQESTPRQEFIQTNGSVPPIKKEFKKISNDPLPINSLLPVQLTPSYVKRHGLHS